MIDRPDRYCFVYCIIIVDSNNNHNNNHNHNHNAMEAVSSPVMERKKQIDERINNDWASLLSFPRPPTPPARKKHRIDNYSTISYNIIQYKPILHVSCQTLASLFSFFFPESSMIVVLQSQLTKQPPLLLAGSAAVRILIALRLLVRWRRASSRFLLPY